ARALRSPASMRRASSMRASDTGHTSSGASCTSRSPLLTVAPAATLTAFTTPAAGAGISFSIFMAVRTSSTSPRRTRSPGCTRTSATVPGMGAGTQPSSRPGAPGAWAAGPPWGTPGAGTPGTAGTGGTAVPPWTAAVAGDAAGQAVAVDGEAAAGASTVGSSSTITSWRRPSTVIMKRLRWPGAVCTMIPPVHGWVGEAAPRHEFEAPGGAPQETGGRLRHGRDGYDPVGPIDDRRDGCRDGGQAPARVGRVVRWR